MNNIAIQLEDVGKRFRIGAVQARYKTIRESIMNSISDSVRSLHAIFNRDLRKADSLDREIWALRNIQIKIKKGEVVGLIGSNGAGKTTLLKILSRITEPTEGLGVVNGRVGSLLEVGTGFHPELTGRENIFLNGAILGMRQNEIRNKFDQIVQFAGIERFIDTPVKHYSSGMYMRLAFSVSAHLEPEILLVDEVLAVGDASFQKKCLGKMGEISGEGRTVILVSHNMEVVMGLCSRAIWLHQGRLMADGPANQIVRNYLANGIVSSVSKRTLRERTDRQGSGEIKFVKFEVRNEQGAPIEQIMTGDTVDFVFSYETKRSEPLRHVRSWFWIRDQFNRGLLYFGTLETRGDFDSVPIQGELICRVPRFPLRPGTYVLDINIDVSGQWADRMRDAIRIEVVSGDFFGTGRSLGGLGLFLHDHSWRVIQNDVTNSVG